MGTLARYYSSLNTGSGVPTLDNTASKLTSLFSACLYGSGFGSVTLTSLTNSGTTATATVSGGHGFLNKQVIEIAGATPSAYNGTFRIDFISSTQFSYTMASDPGGSATGTITAKLPAVGGWQALYSGTGKLALNSTDLSASGRPFRVDDTGTAYARLIGYESMTDVDTGTNPFPLDAQITGGSYLHKATSATTRPWILCASPNCIWLATFPDGSHWNLYGFGDFKSLYAGDLYASFVMGSASNSLSYSTYAGYVYGSTYDPLYAARNTSGSVGAVKCPKRGVGNFSGYGSASSGPNYAAPSPTGKDVIISKAPILIEEYQGEVRGELYGMRQVLNKHGAVSTCGDIITGITGYDDGVLIINESIPNLACLAFPLNDEAWT